MTAFPGAAVIEIVERHRDARKPLDGPGSLIVPNELRINGQPVYAAFDSPVVIPEITVDGSAQSPFVVTVRLQCRVLEVGELAPPEEEIPRAAERMRAATVRIPTGEGAPYAFVNEQKVWLAGPATLSELTNTGATLIEALRVLEVTLPLMCRRLIVDDEPEAQGPPLTVTQDDAPHATAAVG